jgi:uncharacterized membrane protein YedE/YeeE
VEPFLAAGILIGSFIAWSWLSNYHQISLNNKLLDELNNYGINNYGQVVPAEVINWRALFTLKGIILIVVGGFLVGFGTRYGEGCISDHASDLSKPPLSFISCYQFFYGCGFLY